MSFFEIGQELMPLIAPPTQLVDRTSTYQQALDYLSLTKVYRTDPTQVACYRYQLDLTKSGAASSDADLTETEKAYRKLWIPCDAVMTAARVDQETLEFIGIYDPAYAATLTSPIVLTIRPLPHVMAEWTAYVPLILFLPTRIDLYPVDEARLRTALEQFILDPTGTETARDPDHHSRYYRQYKRGFAEVLAPTGAPLKPVNDTTHVSDLVDFFLDRGFGLILRGGAPLGELLAHSALQYHLNLTMISDKRFLKEPETDAFFTYRQRMPVEHQNQYGLLAGHPLAALISALEQATSGEAIADTRARAKLLTEAGLVDFMDLEGTSGHSKYNQNFAEPDHVDYDHHPNVMFLRASQRAEDLQRFPALSGINPFEYVASFWLYDLARIPLYFDFPRNVIAVGRTWDEPNVVDLVTVTDLSPEHPGLILVKSLVDTEQRVEILIRHTHAAGPIVKRLWVQILEPRFIEARFHEVHGGALQKQLISSDGFFRLGTDILFSPLHLGDVSKVPAMLDFWNLNGPTYHSETHGRFSETLSRYGNIFIVNKTTPGYVRSVENTTLSVVDGTDEVVDTQEFLALEYIHEVNSGQTVSYLEVNGLVDDPLWVTGPSLSLDVALSSGLLQLVRFYDEDTWLNVHLTWSLAGNLPYLGDLDPLGIAAPRSPLTTLWHGSKGRTVVMSTGLIAEFLSLVLFHETCHRVAVYFGTGLHEALPFTYSDDVARLVHPLVHILHSDMDFSLGLENYTYPSEQVLVSEKDMSMLLETSASYEPSREQFFPGNVMAPNLGHAVYPSDANSGVYAPAINPRLTYNQVMALNRWLR